MIVDSHVHIGSYKQWKCSTEILNGLMKKNNISLCIASDLAGNMIGARAIEQTIKDIRYFESTFKLLLWINPNIKDDDDIAEEMLEKYRSHIVGIKVHPQTAGVRLGDIRYENYLALCRKYQLPFVVHTEKDGYSNVSFLAQMAFQNQDIDFVAVHMELYSDHKEAFEFITRNKNLYGDTILIAPQDVDKAVEICGSDKILFGSDAPIMEEQSYKDLEKLKSMLVQKYSKDVLEKVMYKNCKKLFSL